jgi:DNA-binding response OmpR family regulator
MKTCVVYSTDTEQVSGVVRDLELLGLTSSAHPLGEGIPDGRIDLACVWTGDDAAGALATCQIVRKEDGMKLVPVLVLVRLEHVRELFLREGVFEDFLVVPYQLAEFDARLRHLLWRAKLEEQTDVLAFGPLVINLATYQVQIDERPIDLTYMEYELLKFLSQHRGRVFTRQALLSRVWGYDYYGGTRTVDVHVRRLRAKLDEHANLIQTVRNVGYKFAG